MLRQLVPNDSSCLFAAIGYCRSGSFEPNTAIEQRRMCVNHMKRFPEKFTKIYLGKSVEEYCQWIMMDTSWGGEVEILIIAELFQVQISVVQIETLSSLIYRPPLPRTHESCCDFPMIYLLYTGQHYDSLVSSDDRRSGIFPADGSYDEPALACARSHRAAWESNIKSLKRRRIKCGGCGAVVNDAASFQQHCIEVEHSEEFSFECEDIEEKGISERDNYIVFSS